MSWIKQCDRRYQYRRSADAGLTAMAMWGALMSHSAHEELDGRLDRRDIADAWTYGFDEDAKLWGGLIAESIGESWANLMKLLSGLDDEVAGKLRLHLVALKRSIQRPELDSETVRETILARLTKRAGKKKAPLLQKPRGNGQHYELVHPDGRAYLREDGGYQISAAQAEHQREVNREKQRARRAREKEAREAEAEVAAMLGGALVNDEAPDIAEQSSAYPGDDLGHAPGDDLSERDRAPNSDPIGDPSDRPSSIDRSQTRPTAARGESVPFSEEELARELASQKHFAPLAPYLSAELFKRAKKEGLPHRPDLGRVVAEAHRRAVKGYSSTRVAHPRAWLSGLIWRCLAELHDGSFSELEHEARKRAEAAHFRKRRRRSTAEEREQERVKVIYQRAEEQRRALAAQQGGGAFEKLITTRIRDGSTNAGGD